MQCKLFNNLPQSIKLMSSSQFKTSKRLKSKSCYVTKEFLDCDIRYRPTFIRYD